MNPIVCESVETLIRSFIKPQMHIHFASTMSRANATINALVKEFQGEQPNFTISVTAMHGNLHAISLSGIAKHVITCFLGDNYPNPKPNQLYAEILNNKPFSVEQWSLLSFTQRLMCGALNMPYIITESLLGSDLIKGKIDKAYIINDPSNDKKKLLLLKPLLPDITLVHGICADKRGNVILSSPYGEGQWGCLAAQKGVLVTVEKIVSDNVIKKYSDRVLVPSDRVLGICEVPYGAHPQSMKTDDIAGIKGYLDDYDFLVEAKTLTNSEETSKYWFNKWINLEDGQQQYINLLGSERLKNLSQISLKINKSELPKGEVSVGERLIILAARSIVEKVKKKNYKTILAGIGFAHIAAWVAEELLKEQGIKVQLMAELGFYGVAPHHGDVFLFSQRHAEDCQQRSGIVEILGSHVGYQGKCLGILGAAEIDIKGNINTTMLYNKRFLVGSGGANDIASVTDCMVVTMPGKNRLVNKVAFVTSPGDRITDVVTPFGRLSRSEKMEAFKLETWLHCEKRYQNPKETLVRYTDWPININDQLIIESEISDKERQLIYSIDKEGVYR